MTQSASDVDGELDKMFWKAPAVIDSEALLTPFFSTKPLPRTFSKPYVSYVLSAFLQLSQLTHEVAVNAPSHGSAANLVLRNFLIFHIERIVSAVLDDPIFMEGLLPANADDHDAVSRIEMLRTAGTEFSTRWHTVRLAENKRESFRVIKQCWVATKSAADVISRQTASFQDAETRIKLRLPWWRVADIFTTEGIFPPNLVILWLCWGGLVALLLDAFVWLIWHTPKMWMPIVATIVCTTGFGGFLVFFYTLTRRNTVTSWYAELLSTHFASEHYRQRGGKASRIGEQDLEFFIGGKRTLSPRKLTISPSVINRQVVMIGIKNVKELRICSWNFSARLATNIRWEDAIGKSLDVVLVPESSLVAQTMFNELKERGKSGQHRLLFNTVNKGKVPISASATIAYVDGSPIGMIVGTVIEEEERAVMTYFSRAGLCAVLDHLKDVHHLDSPTTTHLVLSNTFELLKERTTSTIRNWRSTEKDELINLLQNPAVNSVRTVVHCTDNVPQTFQCDYMQTERVLAELFNGIDNATPEHAVSVSVSFREYNSDGTGGAGVVTMLQVLIQTEFPCHVNPSLEQSLQENLSHVGYLVQVSDCSVRMLFPVTPTAISVSGAALEAVFRRSPTFVAPCTFLIYEPDRVYSAHFNSYFSSHQHRCFPVPTAMELDKLLNSLGSDVSAVILAAGGSHFDAMLKVCRQHNSFVVVTRADTHGRDSLLSHAFVGPPSQSTDIHYLLRKPLVDVEWERFLTYLRGYKKNQSTLQAPTVHECKVVKHISTTESSSVDVVRDIVTGGIMVRKTIFLSHGSTSASVMNEIDILRFVNGSPYVVRYISSSNPNRREICLFFQYCKCGDLSELVRAQPKRRFGASQLALYAHQLFCALKHIHGKGVAHRDIKPQNLALLTREHLQLADFGSATKDPSMAGSIRGGTFRYMAPERFVVLSAPSASMDSVAIHVMSHDEPNAAENERDAMSLLFAEDLWSAGLTLLDIAGAYPRELEGLRTGEDYLAVYLKYRDEQKSIEVQLPEDFSVDPSVRDDATHFLQQLLCFKPLSRTSATQLLSHRFLDSVAWNASSLDESSVFFTNDDLLRVNAFDKNACHQQRSCGSVFTVGDDDDFDDYDEVD